ncbi:MAG: hypothetical protein OWQ55_03125 [Sulfuracidifex metallicus]|nr:hypothetical protein [Sulfuracidifex metallicus]MCY0849733.1 hypothetical protein [Sulfuracidifex metallicus]
MKDSLPLYLNTPLFFFYYSVNARRRGSVSVLTLTNVEGVKSD